MTDEREIFELSCVALQIGCMLKRNVQQLPDDCLSGIRKMEDLGCPLSPLSPADGKGAKTGLRVGPAVIMSTADKVSVTIREAFNL